MNKKFNMFNCILFLVVTITILASYALVSTIYICDKSGGKLVKKFPIGFACIKEIK